MKIRQTNKQTNNKLKQNDFLFILSHLFVKAVRLSFDHYYLLYYLLLFLNSCQRKKERKKEINKSCRLAEYSFNRIVRLPNISHHHQTSSSDIIRASEFKKSLEYYDKFPSLERVKLQEDRFVMELALVLEE